MTNNAQSPFWAGYYTAKAGNPSTDNPHPEPELPAQGDEYPGLWYAWLSGWCMYYKYTNQDCRAERMALHDFIQGGLRA